MSEFEQRGSGHPPLLSDELTRGYLCVELEGTAIGPEYLSDLVTSTICHLLKDL